MQEALKQENLNRNLSITKKFQQPNDTGCMIVNKIPLKITLTVLIKVDS